jgi:hypothetical protein
MSRNSSSGISTSCRVFIIQVMKNRKCMFSGESSNNIETDAPSTLSGSRFTLHDSPSTLSGARSTLSDARSTLSGARFTLSDARSSLSDARFTLSDARFTLNDSRFTLSGSPSTLRGSRSSIHCSGSSTNGSRSYFTNFSLYNGGVHQAASGLHQSNSICYSSYYIKSLKLQTNNISYGY